MRYLRKRLPNGCYRTGLIFNKQVFKEVAQLSHLFFLCIFARRPPAPQQRHQPPTTAPAPNNGSSPQPRPQPCALGSALAAVRLRPYACGLVLLALCFRLCVCGSVPVLVCWRCCCLPSTPETLCQPPVPARCPVSLISAFFCTCFAA